MTQDMHNASMLNTHMATN